MSNYPFYPPVSSSEVEHFNLDQSFPPQAEGDYSQYQGHYSTSIMAEQQYYAVAHEHEQEQQQHQYQHQHQHQQAPFQYDVPHQGSWVQQPTVPSNYPFPSPQYGTTPFPPYNDSFNFPEEHAITSPARLSTGHLSPDEAGRAGLSRTTSFASNASSTHSIPPSDLSRSVSPNASEMAKWGHRNEDGSWSCAFPGCSSRSTFNRGCDLRKHYKRHSKTLFCRIEGCPQATQGGFSSKKDRSRHEAKHNPSIVCEWEGCERLFSRQDNMKDHVRRVHRRRT